MKTRIIVLTALSLAALNVFHVDSASAKSKKYTITQRQEALNAKVTKGEKNNELTKKEADKFRDRLSDVTDHIAKAKEKNGGKLSYKDEGKIEKSLNGISVDVEKTGTRQENNF